MYIHLAQAILRIQTECKCVFVGVNCPFRLLGVSQSRRKMCTVCSPSLCTAAEVSPPVSSAPCPAHTTCSVWSDKRKVQSRDPSRIRSMEHRVECRGSLHQRLPHQAYMYRHVSCSRPDRTVKKSTTLRQTHHTRTSTLESGDLMQCHDTAGSMSRRICPSEEARISLNQTLRKSTVGEQPV